MYNRYIPQSDGSYRRSQMPEPHPRPHPQRPESRPPCPPPPPEPCYETQPQPKTDCDQRPPSRPAQRCPRPTPPPKPSPPQQTGIGTFLRQLLPRDFDTGDLLVVLLLLLMAGDCTEDQNSALLTLVLYLFL